RRQRSRWAVFIGRSYGGVVMARKEGLIGRKVGMTQVFSEDGSHVPVTVIEAGPCPGIEIRTTASHGYDALPIGLVPKKKHGSMFYRAPGSIGASSDPSRVWPGHHLPGRMGGDRRTVLNLSVVRVMPEQSLVLVRGAVPGANGSLVMVRKSVKAKKAPPAKSAEKK